jgi:phosphoadenosine phosphosulfate reductase
VQTLFHNIAATLDDKIADAIKVIQTFEPKDDGYFLAFSGGKDSCVLKELAKLSGVRFESWYSQTTIDPPELIRFIKQYHPDVKWNRPKRNFFKAIEISHGLPSRLNRWCCEEYKEGGGNGRVVLLGVRAAESIRRKKTWKTVTIWQTKTSVCPILHWTDEDVWSFIRARKIPYCTLYDEGFKRLGCIGCPMAGKGRKDEFARWPGFEKAYRIATQKYWDRRKGKLNNRGKHYFIERFRTATEFFDWWLSDKPSKKQQDECLNLSFGNE